jgi:DNA mismatch repair protein MutS
MEETKEYSPMIKQYLEIKEQYPDYLLFFRLGDFYELFNSDALIVSKELDIILTRKMAGNKQYIPMAGVPHHASEVYAQRLLAKNYKIAICDQLEDAAQTKGLVKRGVVKILTPGTKIVKSDEQNSFIASYVLDGDNYHLAFVDFHTGENYVAKNLNKVEVLDTLRKYSIDEVIVASAQELKWLKNNHIYANQFLDLTNSNSQFENLALINVINYLKMLRQTNKIDLTTSIPLDVNKYMRLDANTINALELITNLNHAHNDSKTVFNLLNTTKTVLGARRLKHLFLNPLIDVNQINQTHKQIEDLIGNNQKLNELVINLKDCYDLERIIVRAGTNNIHPSNILQLFQTLNAYNSLKKNLNWFEEINVELILSEINKTFNLQAIEEESSQFINYGIDDELDQNRKIALNTNEWLNEYLETIKQKIGINQVKIGQNKVFGYYLEISRNAKFDMPEEFTRKQTLSSAERYTTDELNQKEIIIKQAQENMVEMQNSILLNFNAFLVKVKNEIIKVAQQIASFDVIQSFTTNSLALGLVKPEFTNTTKIIGARHLVVEKMIGKANYTANNLSSLEQPIKLITGPNMAGKSTFMKQICVLQIMAQIGSFVPAQEAKLEIKDAIFTRIGSIDDLINSKSTFMLEMEETALALKGATKNSLIVFDELGRGTATFDGLAIAKAVLYHIAKEINALTLFSTHYHELAQLSEEINNIENLYVEVKELNGNISFTHRVKKGSISKSYGINVARLAKLPINITTLATKFIDQFENNAGVISNENLQLESLIIEEIEQLPIDQITPVEALNILQELKNKVKK